MVRQYLHEAKENLHFSRSAFESMSSTFNYSKREGEVARLLCQGLTYRGIGEKLYISENTVDNTVQKIYVKTGVKSKIELIRKIGVQIPS